MHTTYSMGAINIITTQEQFDKILNIAITKCVQYICDNIYECLQKHIMDDVYNFDTPNTWYEGGSKRPTFEFLNAFKFEGIKQKSKEISNLLFYNWQTMSPPSSSRPYVHGNLEEGIDRREQLASILNVSGVNGSYDFRGKERNAFWDRTLDEVEKNFDRWAKEAYNKYLK